MAEYIELIDKYRIVQSKDTDYNPPSYDWVDNTGEIVRCKDCKHCDPENYHCDHYMGTVVPLSRKPDDFCSYGERKDGDGNG